MKYANKNDIQKGGIKIKTHKKLELFKERIKSGQEVIDIIHLPDIEQSKNGKLIFPMCDLFDRPGLCYTSYEFRLNLANTIKFLKKYDNYNVILSDEIPFNEIIYVKDDVGAIIVKAETPSVAFAIG